MFFISKENNLEVLFLKYVYSLLKSIVVDKGNRVSHFKKFALHLLLPLIALIATASFFVIFPQLIQGLILFVPFLAFLIVFVFAFK
ncbi:hypothetical protein L8C07_05565 [Paenibacillus sp. CMAA1739]|uniref:hypothetical protein n=1 Tax=Paenibacillus ottowii TaxID=2315729 RepID=UPI002DB8F53A|nr:hypothetical protein [Paenibacillus sp. CMAA1739]MEC4565406.1 hypothetical protein [Paenibacillus sp. CMAA1739]